MSPLILGRMSGTGFNPPKSSAVENEKAIRVLMESIEDSDKEIHKMFDLLTDEIVELKERVTKLEAHASDK